MSRFVRKRWIALLLIAIVVALLSAGFRFSLFFNLFSMDHIIRWVESAQRSGWLVALFYVIFAVGVMILPITLFPIIGGVLLNFWISLPLNIAAATLGGWLAFRVGRAVGREAIAPFMRGNLRAVDRLAASAGIRTVLLLRIVGIPPFAIANYGMGLSTLRNRDFVAGTALGILPWMTLVTYLSTTLWQAVLVGGEKGLASALLKAGAPLTAVSLSVSAVVGVTWFVKRRRKARGHSNL